MAPFCQIPELFNLSLDLPLVYVAVNKNAR